MERFTAVCEEPARHQAAVLRHLLHLHRATTHLRRHGIQLPANFGAPEGDAQGAGAAAEDAGVAADAALRLLRQLPLTTYGDYAALIDEAVEAGRAVSEAHPESQRRWEAATAALTGAQPVYAFWCSSGGWEKCCMQWVAPCSACMAGWLKVIVAAADVAACLDYLRLTACTKALD